MEKGRVDAFVITTTAFTERDRLPSNIHFKNNTIQVLEITQIVFL